MALELILVLVLVAGNAFFVIAEYALVTARRGRLSEAAEGGNRGAAVALKLMDDPVRVISTVQIAITGLGILLGAIGEPAVRDLFGDVLPSWAAFPMGFLVVTYLSVAFGELVPKAFALYAPEAVARLVARPIALCGLLFTPAVKLLQWSTRLVLKPLGVPAVTAGDRPISREELRWVLQEAEEHGALHSEEEAMLTGVIDLRVRQARDVMRPWDDVTYVRLDEPTAGALDTMLGAAHTRFPAVLGDGEVVGVVHARDVWNAWRAAGPDDTPELRPLVRPPVIVPPTVRIDALLRQLRRERQQLAVVVDEYGRPAGIVTIEDILEEIVGEIEDEFDALDARFERVGDGEWIVDGAVSVNDFNRRAGTDLDVGRAHSLGGVLYEHFGRVPAEGERMDLDGVSLTVERLDGHRIGLVRAVVRREGEVA